MRMIASLLLENRAEGTDWGEMSQLKDKPCEKRLANRFLLCCLLDYQMSADVAWRNGERLVYKILGDPDDIWKEIASVSESEWKSKRSEYKLHRFPNGHNRLWRIATRIHNEYGGDARRIWDGRNSQTVLEVLWDLGAGEQLSRMIVGALRDCGQIKGASDVKADVYVCRVLGRALFGETIDPETAVRLARHMHPDPWQLDAQLWYIGKSFCEASNPKCSHCYLGTHCAHALGQKHLNVTSEYYLPPTQLHDGAEPDDRDESYTGEAIRERFKDNDGWTTVIDGQESRAKDLRTINTEETMATSTVEDDATFHPIPSSDHDVEIQLKQKVDDVYSAIQKSTLNSNAVLYRKENWPAETAKSLFKTGSVVQRAGFVSTSKSPNVWPGNVRLTIDAPKGTHAIDVHGHNLTEQPIEKEVILQHNLAYKVLSVDEVPGIVLHIHLRIVPFGERNVAKSVEDDMERFLPLPNDTSDEEMWTNPETGEWEWSPFNFDSPRAAENSREKFTENGGWSELAD
jgi:endonuclease III